MKKWEEEQRLKNYSKQITRAKAQVPPTTNPKSSSKVQRGTPSARVANDSITSDRISITSDSKTQMPLYRLLKLQNLQQYAQYLMQRGFGDDLTKFATLSKSDIDRLTEEMNVLPVFVRTQDEIHQFSRFFKWDDGLNAWYINLKLIFQEFQTYTPSQSSQQKRSSITTQTHSTNIFKKQKAKQATPSQQQQQRSRPQTSQNAKPVVVAKPHVQAPKKIVVQPTAAMIKPKNPPPQLRQQTVKVQQIGYDFFRDDDIDNEFNKTLENILRKYQTQDGFSNQINQQPQFQGGIQPNTKGNQQSVNQQPRQSKPDIVLKSKAQDDIVLIGQFKGEKIETNLVENRLIRNLEKRLVSKKGRKKNKFEEYEDVDNYPDLQVSQIKHMYQSYDQGKLTSTLINLDIEEMSNCLSWAILKHIEFSRKKLQSMLNNSSVPFSIGNKFRNTQNLTNNDNSQNPVEEPTYLNYNEDQQNGLFQSQQIRQQQQRLGMISEKTLEMSNQEKVKKPQVQEYYEDWEQSRQQIQALLKESLLMKNMQQEEEEEEQGESFNDQLYDEVNSDEQEEDLSRSEEQSPIKRKYVECGGGRALRHLDQESVYDESQPNNFDYSHSQHNNNNNNNNINNGMELSFVSRFDVVEVDHGEEERQKQKLFYQTYCDDNKELGNLTHNHMKIYYQVMQYHHKKLSVTIARIQQQHRKWKKK